MVKYWTYIGVALEVQFFPLNQPPRKSVTEPFQLHILAFSYTFFQKVRTFSRFHFYVFGIHFLPFLSPRLHFFLKAVTLFFVITV